MDRQIKMEYISNFFDFCYADLENLTIDQKGDWIQHAAYSLWVYSVRGEPFLYMPKDSDKEQMWHQVEELQADLIDDIEWLYRYISEGKRYYCQIDISHRFSRGIRDVFNLAIEAERKSGIMVKVFEYEDTKHQKAFDEKEIHVIFSYIFEALDGFGVSSLFRCPNCGKISFNPTKREKKYCSPKCQNAAAVQRLRKKKE